MKIWVTVLLLLLVPIPTYNPPVIVVIDMKPVVTAGQSVHYTIFVDHADSLSYSFWYQLPDSTFVNRTGDKILDVRNMPGIQGMFQTCSVMTFQLPSISMCRPEWVLGMWQVRAFAWRWRKGYRFAAGTMHKFVVQ